MRNRTVTGSFKAELVDEGGDRTGCDLATRCAGTRSPANFTGPMAYFARAQERLDTAIACRSGCIT
jgi:hypothetical protein